MSSGAASSPGSAISGSWPVHHVWPSVITRRWRRRIDRPRPCPHRRGSLRRSHVADRHPAGAVHHLRFWSPSPGPVSSAVSLLRERRSPRPNARPTAQYPKPSYCHYSHHLSFVLRACRPCRPSVSCQDAPAASTFRAETSCTHQRTAAQSRQACENQDVASGLTHLAVHHR